MGDINSIKQLVKYAADKYQDKDFCRFFRGDELFKKSYREFNEDCLAVCRYIRSVRSDKMHIAFIGKTSYEYIACLTGMIFSGNVVIPFDPDISVDEACELFDDADIEMLFCEDDFSEKAEQIQKRYKGIKKVVSLGDWAWFDNVFHTYSGTSQYGPLSDEEYDPDECALIVYTSGTTGVRKGVMLSNHGLAANTCYNEYCMEDDEVILSVLPMHHVFCYCCDVLKTMYDGGTICLNGALVNMYKNLLFFQPTAMRIVPTLCKSLLTKIKITEKRNPDLTPRQAAEAVCGKNFVRILSGSAFLSALLIDEFEKYGITARQGYGMTECSPRVSTTDFSDVCKYSNGKVLSVNELRICDGEIQVKGPCVMLGYYKKPQETREAMTDDGWLRTGDLGYLNGEHIYLIGRKKNLIVLSNGENISPEKIENRFIDDGLVREIVVYAENDKIVAQIYPDKELARAHSVSDIEGEIDRIVDRVNIGSPSDEQIHSYILRDKPFEKSASGKIKRTEFYYKKRGNQR